MNEDLLNINQNKCPSTLKEGNKTYTLKAVKDVFGGTRVSHILNYLPPQKDGEDQKKLFDDRTKISISGVQAKYSLRIENKELISTSQNGEYILKPIPTDLSFVDQVPANEHLSMQLASQVFRLNVAKNALVFFRDGSPAYITRRFDVLENGNRTSKEDFASLAQQTSQNGDKDYKYNFSYLGISKLIDQYLPSAIKQKEEFFKLVLFNYLICNGDAHLKNFSVIDYSGTGDYMLAPGYDLINTSLHVDDSDLALIGGLYERDYEHPSFSIFGFYAYDDFVTFGEKMGLMTSRIKRFIDQLISKNEKVEELISRSYLNDEMKIKYFTLLTDRVKRLHKKL